MWGLDGGALNKAVYNLQTKLQAVDQNNSHITLIAITPTKLERQFACDEKIKKTDHMSTRTVFSIR